MDKIYVVTAGCCEDYDYRIEAIFSDEEKANKYKEFKDKKVGEDGREVEEYFVDIPLTDYCISGTYSYRLDSITYTNIMHIESFPLSAWNVRRGDWFCFAVKYEEKYDDDEVLLETVRELAKEWEDE